MTLPVFHSHTCFEALPQPTPCTIVNLPPGNDTTCATYISAQNQSDTASTGKFIKIVMWNNNYLLFKLFFS